MLEIRTIRRNKRFNDANSRQIMKVAEKSIAYINVALFLSRHIYVCRMHSVFLEFSCYSRL